MNILFVCSANISRSFLAEMLLKNEMEKLKLDNVDHTIDLHTIIALPSLKSPCPYNPSLNKSF